MKKKKILFAANLESFFTKFLIPQLKYFKENGYEVHVAAKSENIDIPYCDKKFDVDFARGFNIKQNVRSYKQMKRIFKDEHYDIVSCHTPFGAAITRLAYKNSKVKGTKMVYMNHGFHFYKGAPLLNWLLFYPAEKYLAKYTDTLITINLEDYELSKKKFKTNTVYVKGIGLDPSKFDFEMTDKEKLDLRKSLGLKKDDFVMIYPAELLPRKRQIWLINTLSELLKENSNFKLLLPGKDSMNGACQKLVSKLNLDDQIKFLGFRKDIPQLLRISDLALTSSKQEGLPVNVMEAIYCGLPVVATNCRGNRDLIEDGKNGYVVELNDSAEFCNKILYFSKLNSKEKNVIKKENENIIKDYLKDSVIESIVNNTIPNNKIKVLHLLASNKFSGAENVVCTIINNFKDEYDMAYCSPVGPIEETLQQQKIKYYGLKGFSLRELKKVIKMYKPDIIHAHDYRASILVAFSGFNGKIISHLHNNCPFAKKWNFKTILYSLCVTKFDKVVGVSNRVYDEAAFKNQIKNKYITIYNYIDKNLIVKKSNEYSSDKKYDLFFIGRLTEQKDPIRYINIVREYKKINNNVTAVMIGSGELSKYCYDKIQELDLEQNIDMVGFVPNPFPIIKNSKVGIMPSKWEGFGLTAIEAMILGKPVLNSGAGGLKEIFKDNQEYVCKTNADYVNKIIKLSNMEFTELNINFQQYCDLKYWRTNFDEEVYK